MINRIIAIDKKFRKSVEKTHQLKIESEQKIQNMSAKKREEYLNKAKLNVKILEHGERLKANTKLKDIENKYKDKFSILDRVAKDNFDKWVDLITNKVIG